MVSVRKVCPPRTRINKKEVSLFRFEETSRKLSPNEVEPTVRSPNVRLQMIKRTGFGLRGSRYGGARPQKIIALFRTLELEFA